MGAVGSVLAEGAGMAAWSVRLAVAAIFLEAAQHALGDRAHFAAAIGAYRVLPEKLVGAASFALPVLQLVAAFALMVPLLAREGAGLALLLLLLFTAAIAVNLRRGRRDIDCGCGGGAVQKISPALLLRNLLLCICLACTLAAPVRLAFGAAATVGLAGFGVFLVGLYFAANQLMSNAQAFAAQDRGVAA
jgi:hypothetical protein